MKKANDESSDSPFRRDGQICQLKNTRTLKQKLCGGISCETPTYFHLNYVDVLDSNSRMQELYKGYKTRDNFDELLLNHPDRKPQEKKYFSYQNFSSFGNVFDYSSIKPSNIIDLKADKRPLFKQNSIFYQKYNEKLKNDGFGRVRGIFTVESNHAHKFGFSSNKHFKSERLSKGYYKIKKAEPRVDVHRKMISDQAFLKIPVQYRTAKNGMSRFLSNNVISNKKRISSLSNY